MKTFLDRFRRKGKGDEPSDSVADLFGSSPKTPAPSQPEAAPATGGAGTHSKPAAINLTPVPSRANDNYIRLELGDFLHRIPQNLLRPGPHDVTTQLLFDINELSSLIANGQTTINLAEVHRRVPDVFRSPVSADDKVEIRFPWQKLMHLVKSPSSDPNGAGSIAPATAEALAQKIRSRRPARNSPPGTSSRQQGTANPPTPAFRSPSEEKIPLPAKPEAPGAQQLSWFTKPGTEKSPEAPAPARDALPAENSAPFNRDEIVRARDAATLKLAETKAEFERQTERLSAERDAITHERDRAVAELEKAKAELAAKIQHIEQHENLGAQQARETASTIAERDALQQEITAKDARLATLTEEIAGLKTRGTEASNATLQERENVVADLAAIRGELVEKNEQIEFHQSMAAKSAEDAARLLEERTALQKEIAAQSTAIDAIKSELDAMRKGGGEKYAAIAEERDRVRAELANAREELAAKVVEIETQKSLADKSVAEVEAANAAREALRNELAEKASRLETLTSELDSHRKGGAEKLTLIEQERDSLLQLKAKLSDQLSEATTGLAAKQKAVVEVGLSKKENQRQLEELQRRITAFESGQRATSQELNREREIRIKAERSLAAAERARQEASALIESMRTETKRESDAATRKRETEAARAQKELQERIEALTEANRKALAERDARTQEIEKMRVETAALTTAAQAAATGAQWEARAVAGFEQDIAKYRDRIKSLLADRDSAATAAKAQIEELTRARDTAARELENSTATHAKSAAENDARAKSIAESAATFEKEKAALIEELEKTRQALAERAEQLASAKSQAETEGGATAELRRQLESITGERDRAQTDWEKLVGELDGVKAEAKQQAEHFAAERAKLDDAGTTAITDARRKADELQTALTAATDGRATLLKSLETAASEHQSQLAALRAEWEPRLGDASAQLEKAKAEHAKEIASLKAAHEKQLESQGASARDLAKTIADNAVVVTGLTRQLDEAKAATGNFSSERATLQKDLEAAMELLNQDRSGHDNRIAALNAEHEKSADGLRAEIAALQKSAAANAAERAQFQKDIDAATELLNRVQAGHDTRLATLATEHEQALGGLRAEIAELQKNATATTSERAQFQKDIDAATELLNRTQAGHDQRLATLATEHEQALGGLRGEIAELQKNATATTSERAQFQKDIDAATELLNRTQAGHDQRLATLATEHEQTLGGLRGEIAELQKNAAAGTSERAQLQKKIDAAKAEGKKSKADYEKQIAAIRAEHAALNSTHQTAASEFSLALQTHETAVASLQGELSRTKTDTDAELARTREQQDELRARLEARERDFNETKKALEDRVADAERATAEIADRAQSLDTIVRNRDNALGERDAAIVELKTEHEASLAALAREHDAGLDSMTAEKDRQLAALTVERAKAVAALSRERDDFAAKLEEIESSLTAQINTLSEARDEAVRESTALAQRLAAFAVESDRKFDDLRHAHDAAASERQTLSAQLESARDEHKAQSAVFAREFKGIVKQRDETASTLDAVRGELAEKTAALAREQANLAKVEAEVAARFERDVSRMRRDRDVLVRQRDELHARIAKMVDEQRELLEELTAQTTRHAPPMPTDVVQKPRAAKESNVIEISASQIVQHADPDHGINLPRVRPVPVPPPNVRIL